MVPPGTDPPAPPPALVIGSTRRRLARRNGLPRSHTAPVLGGIESATSELAEDVTADTAAKQPYASTAASLTGTVFEETSIFSPTHRHLVANHHERSEPHAFPKSPTDTSLVNLSPTLKGPSADTKRRYGFLNIKLKDVKLSGSCDTPTISSPLPHNAPAKAARFFGLSESLFDSSSYLGLQVRKESIDNDPLVRPELSNKCSTPMLTRREGNSAMQQANVKTDRDKTGPSNDKYARETSGSKARQLLDFLPFTRCGAKRAYNRRYAASSPAFCSVEDDTNSPRGQYHHPDLPAGIERLPSCRSSKKKRPKSLERMTPITEASHDELHSRYRDSEYNTELEVISEYESMKKLLPQSAALLPRSYTTDFTLTSGEKYMVKDDELSSEGSSEFEYEAEEIKLYNEGQPVDPMPSQWEPPAAVSEPAVLSIPDLQLTAEKRSLNFMEQDLEEERAKLDKIDAEIQQACSTTAALKDSHEKLKNSFEAIKKTTMERQGLEPGYVEGDDDEDTDLVSLRSSIDLDEEPTVHVASARVVFTRVTPGMVKLVDIPPRKKPVPTGNTDAGTASRNVLNMDDKKLNLDVTYPKNAKVLEKRSNSPAPTIGEKSPILRPRSFSKHYCLTYGHIMRPIKMDHAFDSIGINSLQARRGLQTSAGVEQHVSDPVRCEKCDRDATNELWECQIPVCRALFCKCCANNMEDERVERAINSWYH